MLGGIRANPYLIDAIIGFSVVYKAFENMDGFRRFFGFQPNTRVAVLVFGLFHGFGLATKLQEFALSPNGLVTNIVSFNVGVEIGQVLALTAILIALSYWRTRSGFLRHAFATNAVVMACGFLLVGYQLSGYFLRRRDEHMTTTTERDGPARHRIAVAAGAALLAAGLILVMFVLPAEYGVDPTRHRRPARAAAISASSASRSTRSNALGTPAAGGQAVIVAAQERPFNQETRRASRSRPRGSIEYKYRLDKGEALLLLVDRPPAPVELRVPRRARRRAAWLRADLREGRSGAPGVGHADRAVLRHSRLVLGERQRPAGHRHADDRRLLQPVARVPDRRAGQEQDVPLNITGRSTIRPAAAPAA